MTIKKLIAGTGPIGAILLVSMMIITGSASAGDGEFDMTLFKTKMHRDQTVPSAVGGFITKASLSVKFNSKFSKTTISLNIVGGDTVFAVHLHCGFPGIAGPILVDILNPTIRNEDLSEDCASAGITNIVSLAWAMRFGGVYAAIHTNENPANEMRGQLIEFEN